MKNTQTMSGTRSVQQVVNLTIINAIIIIIIKQFNIN